MMMEEAGKRRLKKIKYFKNLKSNKNRVEMAARIQLAIGVLSETDIPKKSMITKYNLRLNKAASGCEQIIYHLQLTESPL